MLESNHWFEQPVDETIRLSLRLETLFALFKKNQQDPTQSATQQALAALVRIIGMTDRGDLKNKLITHVMQQITTLMQLKNSPHIDADKLDCLIEQIEADLRLLRQVRQKFGESLRQNQLLNQIRSQLNAPMGLCSLGAPQYSLWLDQSAACRANCLAGWMDAFKLPNRVLNRLLKIIRDSAVPQQVHAAKGYYEQTLDPNNPCHLVRVNIDCSDRYIYPVISVGKHRVVVQLHEIIDLSKGISQKCYDAIPFKLSLCRL